jgi:hypothetical protein
MLLQLYEEYKLTGAVSYSSDEAATIKYSPIEMAKRSAEVPDTVTH